MAATKQTRRAFFLSSSLFIVGERPSGRQQRSLYNLVGCTTELYILKAEIVQQNQINPNRPLDIIRRLMGSSNCDETRWPILLVIYNKTKGNDLIRLTSLGQHFHFANVDFYFVEGIGKKMRLDTHVSAIDSADTAGID
jgi:hypothetical protein